MMISSIKVERFEPFGKAFCLQHPFAGSTCESLQDSRSKQDTKSPKSSKSDESVSWIGNRRNKLFKNLVQEDCG